MVSVQLLLCLYSLISVFSLQDHRAMSSKDRDRKRANVEESPTKRGESTRDKKSKIAAEESLKVCGLSYFIWQQCNILDKS